jgi:hypothetical protein
MRWYAWGGGTRASDVREREMCESERCAREETMSTYESNAGNQMQIQNGVDGGPGARVVEAK